jgi:uncharacterized protein (DUF2141 family)
MKLFAGVLAAALVGMAAPAFAGDVTVTLTGVQAKGGQMLVSLQSRDQFMQPAAAAGAKAEVTAAGDLTVVIPNVPAGDYAVVVLHDEDGNFQMAREPNGKPREGWAMSGAFPGGRPPTFDQVKISVPAGGASVTEAMVYPN